MAGLYIFVGLIIIGVGTLIYLRTKWNRADKASARKMEDRIENEQIEAVAKAEARGKK